MAGRIVQGIGVAMMLTAIVIAVQNVNTGYYWVLAFDAITFMCGIANVLMGTKRVRQDREERIFTEAHPRRLRERRDAWLNRGK
jgi:general stress protein CsbA